MKYWDLVNKVITQSDVLVMVLDARHPHLSRNKEIEDKIIGQNKKIVYVLNKVDLAPNMEPFDLKPVIKVSAKSHKGTMNILRYLSRLSEGHKITVGVLGYPNTGKSSVINALKGKSSAPVSSISGHTKSVQQIRVTKNIMLIDTPGVFPKHGHDEVVNTIIGAKDVQKLKEFELVAEELIDALAGEIEKKYGVEKNEDTSETLESLAIKLNYLKRGGEPDTARTAKKIIRDVQISEGM